MHRLLLSSFVFTLVLNGCSVDLSVDGDPQIACADDSDCPPGLVCSDALDVCIPEEASRRGLLELTDISVTPRARAGTTLFARFRLAKPLPLEPEVELRSELSFSFIRDASSTELEHVYRYEVLGNEGDGDWPVFVSYVDPSGVAIADTLLGQAELDFVAPSIAGAVARTAAIIGRDQSVQFTFSASEPLGPSPRVWLQLTTIGARELALTSAGAGNSYTFEYATIGDELDGPADLVVGLEDLAGNTGNELEPAAVTLDLTGPSVVPLTDSVELIPALDNPIRVPSAACAGTVVRVVFSLSEATVAPPAVTGVLTSDTDTAVVTFANLPSAGVTHAAEYVVTATGSDPTEDLRVRIDATDLYNNDAVILLDLPTGAFRIDTLPPLPPAVGVEGRVTYTRIPWGSEATGGLPFFEVDGDGDAVEDDAWAVAYDGPRIRAANEIGRARADQLGAFTGLDLGGADRTRVYLAAVDDAGNVSDVLGLHDGDERADPIRDVLWTASLIGRLPGSSVENPNVAWTLTGTIASRAQRSTQRTEPSLDGALDASDGAALSTRGRWLWRERHAVTANPTPREGPGLAYDAARGRIVLFGGNVSASSGSCDGTGLLYCGETWEWDGTRWFNPQPPFPRPSPRYDPAMAYDSRRGRVLMFGGQDAGYGYRLNDLWAWDGTAWTELTPAVSPPGRLWHAMTYDSARDRLVLFGGWGSVDEPECDDPALDFMDPGTCDDTWEFDGELWTEVSIGSGPARRYLHGLAYDSRRQRVVLFGGQGNDPDPATGSLSRSDTWEWNGETWLERTPASGNAPARIEHALAFAPGLGRVLMFGGADDFGVLSNEVWAWDGSTWSLVVPNGASITGRRQHDVTYDAARSALFVFGGSDPGGTQRGAWILRQNRWADATTGPSFSGRSTVAAAYDAGRNQVLLFGGYRFPVTCSGPLGTCDDTWSWNGYAWSNVTPSTAGPGGRRLHGMVYDATRGRIVLISGSGSTTLDDLWEWDAFAGCDPSDGACWQDRTPASTPGPLRSFAAAFDSRRHRAVVFGGHDGTTVTDETWEYDGSTWFQRSPASSPPPRQGAAMAYDPVRERTVLFGGTVGATGYLDDTWEWDWEAWTEVTPPTPSPAARTGHSLVWSDARQRILLYGGSIDLAVCPTDPAACCNGLFDLCDDTWEWDGASWRKLEVDGAPLRRSTHAAVYHPLLETVVVAGGKTDRESFAGDTWELDTSADARPAVWVQIDWNAADAAAGDVREVSLRAVAGGAGYHVRQQANDVAVAGARLLAWDARRSDWVELDAHGAAGFADLRRSTVDPADAAALVGADGTLQLRFEPRAGAGNAAQEPEIALDYVEATVRYRIDTVPVCGNGVVEIGETCDDGGTTAGDGCGATCAAEGACGDGVTEGAEACDDGQANDDGSADACRTDCTLPRCGDGVVDTGEDCDDGNVFDDANGCDATCSVNAVCGDGVVQPLFEACEPPGTATCDANCAAIEPCCTDSAVPGCAPPGSKAVEGCVCAIEPRCCVLYWAPVCVSLITAGGCGSCP